MELLRNLGPAFIDAAVRGAIVLLIALVLSYLLRRRSAAARHLVWVGAIVVQLALPAFALWGPEWKVAVPASMASASPIAIPTIGSPPSAARVSEPGLPARTVVEQTALSPTPSARTASTPTPRFTREDVLVALWMLGAAAVLIRLAIGTTIVATLARRGERVVDGAWLSLAQRTSDALQIDRPLTLLRGTKLGVPVTWGIVYPVVLLPDDADSWPEERRRFVLVHEMAHVKRLDALTQLAGQLALALFWFNPLVWIANRRMQMEREHACDDYVLRHGTQASMYAEELLAMVRSLGSPAHRSAQPAFAALAMARRSEFEGRMLSILDPVLDRHPLNKGRTLMATLFALALVIPLAAFHPYQRAKIAQTPLATRVTSATEAKPSSPRSDELAPIPPVTREAATSGQPSCDSARWGVTSGASTHIHSNDDDGVMDLDYTRFTAGLCSSATIIGKPSFSAGEDEIIALTYGSHAVFRQRTPTDDREVTITRGPEGEVVHNYRRKRVTSATLDIMGYDDDARRWFASFLPTVLMETGINVGPRVARWMSQGGVGTVLANIAKMGSSSGKSAHYRALLNTPRLTSANLDDIVRHAGKHLASSGDLRAVLTQAASRGGARPRSGSALEEAIANMASSGDKTAVLMQYGQTTDREMLLSVMRIAATVASSGDRTRLLQTLAPRYLNGTDRSLVDAFYMTAAEIPSSGDLSRLLEGVIAYTAQSDAQLLRFIETARGIPSSGDLSRVLIRLVESNVVQSRAARAAFNEAAAAVPSDGDRSRVLLAAARHIP